MYPQKEGMCVYVRVCGGGGGVLKFKCIRNFQIKLMKILLVYVLNL